MTRQCKLAQKWLFDFDDQKTKLLLFDWSNKSGVITGRLFFFLIELGFLNFAFGVFSIVKNTFEVVVLIFPKTFSSTEVETYLF